MKRIVSIIDIDTTIADNTVRAALLTKHCVICGTSKTSTPHSMCSTCSTETDDKITQESWDSFLRPDLMELDSPVRRGAQAIRLMRKHGMEFHFITGRNDRLREVTGRWLSKHVGWEPDRERLIMRGEADYNSPASVYKELALKRLIESEGLQDASFIFFEDDPWVFKVYSKYGICVQCPEGWNYFCPEAPHTVEKVWSP